MIARPRVLIAGISTRAAAESAVRAGFTVTSLDAFADLDQPSTVRVLTLPEAFSHASAARFARGIDCGAVVYLSGFENHPEDVAVLAAGRELWGNAPSVLRRARDPIALADAFRSQGHAVPDLQAAPRGGHWLLKPLRRGGGHGVRPWSRRERVPEDAYLQERIDGPAGSVVFIAAGGDAATLGVMRLLTGDSAFGASGYQYCGNILTTEVPRLLEEASALAQTSTRAFGLVGANGIDFVARDGIPIPVELNPRWSASMELVERRWGVSVFGAHAAACAEGKIAEFGFDQTETDFGAWGKAIVFARRDVEAGDTRAWLGCGDIRDVPRPGTPIPSGRPVCTVFASGPDETACRDALERRAAAVYSALG